MAGIISPKLAVTLFALIAGLSAESEYKLRVNIYQIGTPYQITDALDDTNCTNDPEKTRFGWSVELTFRYANSSEIPYNKKIAWDAPMTPSLASYDIDIENVTAIKTNPVEIKVKFAYGKMCPPDTVMVMNKSCSQNNENSVLADKSQISPSFLNLCQDKIWVKYSYKWICRKDAVGKFPFGQCQVEENVGQK